MPINFSQKHRRLLLRTLRNGRAKAIGAQRLARLIHFPSGGNQVRLRMLIKDCIENDGDLIGAATGRPSGFFIINSLQELEDYVDSLENRTRSDNTRRSALIINWNNNHPTANTTIPILTIT